jgi:hypothetical protein
MSTETISAISAIAQVIIAIAAVIASIAVPIVIHNSQHRFACLEYAKSMHETWIAIDLAILNDEELMVCFDSVNEPRAMAMAAAATPEERKRRWVAYIILNIAYSYYLGHIHRLHPDWSDSDFQKWINKIAASDDLYRIANNAYSGKFRQLCIDARKKIKATALHSLAQPATPSPSSPGRV